MTKESVTILSVVVNAFLGASKIVVGSMINSAALLADGVHSITDFISSLGVYIGTKVAKKPVDKEHPYGHYAAETISGLLVVFLLVVSAVWIIYDGLNSIFSQEVVRFGSVGLAVIIISIILNEAMSRLKFYWGKKEESLALIADAEHSRTDAISSIGVLIALIAVKYFLYADGLIAVLIGAYILKKSYSLGREVVDNLLGTRDEKAEEIVRKHCQEKNIALVNLRTRKIGAIISAEIIIKLDARLKVEEAEAVSNGLQSDLLGKIKNLKYVVVQVESHKLKAGFIRPRWGRRLGSGEGIGLAPTSAFSSFFIPEKKGYRIIIPVKDNEIHDDFGAPEYLVVDLSPHQKFGSGDKDKESNKILEKQLIKNPYFTPEAGSGMKVVKIARADEIITKKIGPGACQRAKEMGVKVTIIGPEKKLSDVLQPLTPTTNQG